MKKKSFEEALAELEAIVGELERGDLPLEKAIARFEEGMRLSKHCSRLLEETEKKVSVLLQEADGSVTEAPFRPEGQETGQ